jgi:hypothetical protein
MTIARQLSLTLGFAAATLAAAKGDTPTFNKDVQPILATHCQSCHRAGEIGPMPLMTYQQVRPWAKAIKDSVSSRRMPPWFADPHVGKFANDRSMPKPQMETLLAWVGAGAPEGNAKDKRAPREFVEGWNIPTPDFVVEMPEPFTVPKEGKVDYQYLVLPMNLKEDKWVQMAEARPSDRSVVHHIVVFARHPQSNWLRGEAEYGKPFTPPRTLPDGRPRNDIAGNGNEIITIYTPGNLPDVWKPGQAKLITAGSDIVLQLHYTANGKKDGVDRSKVGLVFAKEPPKERVMTVSATNSKFAIPPGEPNYPVTGGTTLRREATLLSFFPHMHLRGKAFDYSLTEPGKPKEQLLKVTPYKFDWQLTYKLEQPRLLPAGSRVEATGYFDNSPNNPFNPDPKATVTFGEQSWEEMMIGFFDICFDAKLSLREFFSPPPKPAAKPANPAAE